MVSLIEVVLPVFLVIGMGFSVTKFGWFNSNSVDALMLFTQRFAIPCLLFKAMISIEIDSNFSVLLLLSYFVPSLAGFLLGFIIARNLLRYSLEKSVVIGFCCLYSNALLLGLPVMEQAYGKQSLGPNFAIIAINTPFCYAFGIIIMESVRGRGNGFLSTMGKASIGILKNILVISIILGLLVNITKVSIPLVIDDAFNIFIKAAMPAALFGLGGILVRYKIHTEFLPVLCIAIIALLIKPYIGQYFSGFTELDENSMRAVVLTLGMAPGLNAFIFANMYNIGTKIAASSIIITTILSIISLSFWLSTLT